MSLIKMRKVSFFKFIKSKKDENSIIGDLSRDMQHDIKFPRKLGKMRSFLGHNGCSGAQEALEDAWVAYKKL